MIYQDPGTAKSLLCPKKMRDTDLRYTCHVRNRPASWVGEKEHADMENLALLILGINL